jgi:hypothetical protein
MMIDKGIVLLQICMDLQENMQGSCTDTCPTARVANQMISIQVEEEEEENPVPLYSGIKTEHVVSCMSVCVSLLGRFH